MIVKTNGVVLNYFKYGDSSIIVRILTEELGYGSFIVNSIRSQRSKKSIGHFQPFSILELIVYVKESRDLQRISDFKNHVPLHELHQNFTKSSITLFLTEVLSKLLQSEQSPNTELYYFTSEAIQEFDRLKTGVENFHLQFLLKIASHLGFAIDEFETVFTSIDKLVPHEEGEHVIDTLMNSPFGLTIDANRNIRNEVLDMIINFFRHHTGMSTPKSLAVLRSVLN
ncbi:MAG: DNA repair protein RecO [Cyclobacteriaceae bacterium]